MGNRELDARVAHEVMGLENVRFDAINSVAYFDVTRDYAHWRLIHATPEQRCRAALEAVREK